MAINEAVGIVALVVTLVTTATTIWTALLTRQAILQELRLRKTEHLKQLQNETHRICYEWNYEYRLNPSILKLRLGAANGLLLGTFTLELESLLNHFEGISRMIDGGAMDFIIARGAFYGKLTQYWIASESLVLAERTADANPLYWDSFERTHHMFLASQAKRRRCGVAELIPTEGSIREFLEEEIHYATRMLNAV